MAPRASGILLHPTSLPSPYAIGDLGPEAHRFLDNLAAAGQSVWQMLPLGPPGPNGSPYDGSSAFAADPLLISPQLLAEDGLLDADAARAAAVGASGPVDFERAREIKGELLRRSWNRFQRRATASQRARLDRFASAPRVRFWLEDWALFAALKDRHGGIAWPAWPAPLRHRRAQALTLARRELAAEIELEVFRQFLFRRQWRRLHRAARQRGVRLCGDLPIYVALDSADVWAHPELFEVDVDGRPEAVAGVPPDAFSADGQHWGNPLYRWPRHRAGGYRWWIERLRVALERTDLVRIDHFRGFVACWRIPAGAPTAAAGRWVRGPGRALFRALEGALGRLPLIAEDLGRITPSVERLRHELGLPGMKVLQFGFDEPDSEHLPHHYRRDTVVYTGTHDNDTSRAWFESLGAAAQARARDYLGLDPEAASSEIPWAMIRAALESVADLAVIPLQDLLELGGEARMNLPATTNGNWRWRFAAGELEGQAIARLRRLTELSGRLPDSL